MPALAQTLLSPNPGGRIWRTPYLDRLLGFYRLEVGPQCPWPRVAFQALVAAECHPGQGLPLALPGHPTAWCLASGGATGMATGTDLLPALDAGLGTQAGRLGWLLVRSAESVARCWVHRQSLPLRTCFANRRGTGDLGKALPGGPGSAGLPTERGRRGCCRRRPAHPGLGGGAEADRELRSLGSFFQNWTSLWFKTFLGPADKEPLCSLSLCFRINHEISLPVRLNVLLISQNTETATSIDLYLFFEIPKLL